ncbi:hypothetical protein WMF04_04205 [Sorangium sp. So ce260]
MTAREMTRTQSTITADASARSERGAARRAWNDVRWVEEAQQKMADT